MTGKRTGQGIRLAFVLALLAPYGAAGAQTATQTVTFEVQAINQLAVSGNPASLTITAATAGSAPTSVTNAATTWALTTNETNRKVTAAINSNMPAGVTLSVALGPPTGASSAGSTSLSTVAADVVTGISTLNATGLTITYTLAATSAAGVVPSGSRTVTFTLTAGA